MITKKDLSKAWDKTKRGYGKTVGFVQKYAPQAEERFGRMAQTATSAFEIRPGQNRVQVDFSTPRRNEFVPLPLKKPIKRQRQHNFGSLTFDI